MIDRMNARDLPSGQDDIVIKAFIKVLDTHATECGQDPVQVRNSRQRNQMIHQHLFGTVIDVP